MYGPTRSRFVTAWALIVSLFALAMAISLTRAQRRVEALERELASSVNVARASRPTKPGRTFTASSGYVLNADDLAEADEAGARAARYAAMLEYSLKAHGARRQLPATQHGQP